MTTAVEAKAKLLEKVPAPGKASTPAKYTPPVRRDLNWIGHPAAIAGVSGGALPSHAQPSGATTERHIASTRPIPVWKRFSDILCLLISLPITLPTMAVVVLWVKFTSRGPALFHQERIGRNGKRFVLYKFRSMKMHADTSRHVSHFMHLVRSDSPMVKLDLVRDSRMIPGGCFLRAAGLDELPQLFNVLRGEMSLVGPRPCLPEELRFFTPQQRDRFEALPGLTGLWQVYGKGVATFSEMNAMDALYVRQSSLVLDFSIMMRTPKTLVRQMLEAFQQQFGAGKNSDFASSVNKPVSGYNNQRLI